MSPVGPASHPSKSSENQDSQGNRKNKRREEVWDDDDDDDEVSDVGEEVNMKPLGPFSLPVKTATPSIKIQAENDINFASLQSDRNMSNNLIESFRTDNDRLLQARENQIYAHLQQLKKIKINDEFS